MRHKDYNQSDAPEVIATIWNTYGRYHLARVAALARRFSTSAILCISHCRSNLNTYPFFDLTPPKLRIAVNRDEAELHFWESCIATYRILREENVDLVLTCGYERAETFGALIYARLHGKTCFLMLDNQYEDRPRKWIVELIKKYYLRFFHGFIYGGGTHRDYLRRLGVPADREVDGYNCVDNEAIGELSSRFLTAGRANSQQPYFLCVARLIDKKNLIRLVQAYAKYKSDMECEGKRAWELIVVGEGPLRARITQAIESLGLTACIKLVGQENNFEAVVRYHALAQALILPSDHNEQWGLVVNEAMAAGRPVLVSSQCGCSSSLVSHGENGFTFDGTSVDQIAARMIDLHRNERRLDEMGAKSRALVEAFSTTRFAENVATLLENRRTDLLRNAAVRSE